MEYSAMVGSWVLPITPVNRTSRLMSLFLFSLVLRASIKEYTRRSYPASIGLSVTAYFSILIMAPFSYLAARECSYIWPIINSSPKKGTKSQICLVIKALFFELARIKRVMISEAIVNNWSAFTAIGGGERCSSNLNIS